MAYQLIVSLLVLQSFIGHSEAQLPSVWKPYDVVTYFCSRWYHQCEKHRDQVMVALADLTSCCEKRRSVSIWRYPDFQCTESHSEIDEQHGWVQ